VPANEVQAVLSGLTEEKQDAVMGLLKTVRDSGLVEFSAIGHSRKVNGRSVLPEVYANALRDGKMTFAELRSPLMQQAIGNWQDYDLSEFKEDF